MDLTRAVQQTALGRRIRNWSGGGILILMGGPTPAALWFRRIRRAHTTSACFSNKLPFKRIKRRVIFAKWLWSGVILQPTLSALHVLQNICATDTIASPSKCNYSWCSDVDGRKIITQRQTINSISPEYISLFISLLIPGIAKSTDGGARGKLKAWKNIGADFKNTVTWKFTFMF